MAKQSELVRQHEERIARLEGQVRWLAQQLRELEDPDIDIEVTEVEVHDIKPEDVAATLGPEVAEEVFYGPKDVSMKIGGSTEEQKRAQREAAARAQEAADARKGIRYEGNDIVIAPPTERQLMIRKALVDQIGWENWRMDPRGGPPVLEEDVAKDAYLKGGPFWLYNYDITFVREQRPDVLQRMVEDAMITDVTLANEMSADILKDESGGEPDVAIDNIKSQADYN